MQPETTQGLSTGLALDHKDGAAGLGQLVIPERQEFISLGALGPSHVLGAVRVVDPLMDRTLTSRSEIFPLPAAQDLALGMPLERGTLGIKIEFDAGPAVRHHVAHLELWELAQRAARVADAAVQNLIFPFAPTGSAGADRTRRLKTGKHDRIDKKPVEPLGVLHLGAFP